MRTTIPHLKNLIKARTNNTGFVLMIGNPFFANQSQLDAMREALEDMILQGDENPDRRYQVSSKQQESLKNWLYDLEQKYLYGN